MQGHIVEAIQVEGGGVPHALDAEAVDVLVVGVDQVDFSTVGHHPDADAVGGLPARGLREVIDAERDAALADVHVVEHHLHDAVGVLHLEALASVREGTHHTREAGGSHEVSVSQAAAARGVVVAGETELTTGGCEVHVGLTRVVVEGVVL